MTLSSIACSRHASFLLARPRWLWSIRTIRLLLAASPTRWALLGLVEHIPRAFGSLLHGIILEHLESIYIYTRFLCCSRTFLLALLTLLLRCAFERLLVNIFLLQLCLSRHYITHSHWWLRLLRRLHYFDINLLLLYSGLALFLIQFLFKPKLHQLLFILLAIHLFLYLHLILLQLLQYLCHIRLRPLLIFIWLLPFLQIQFQLASLIRKLLGFYALVQFHALHTLILLIFGINFTIYVLHPFFFVTFLHFNFWLNLMNSYALYTLFLQ